jgi:hypothetical protein
MRPVVPRWRGPSSNDDAVEMTASRCGTVIARPVAGPATPGHSTLAAMTAPVRGFAAHATGFRQQERYSEPLGGAAPACPTVTTHVIGPTGGGRPAGSVSRTRWHRSADRCHRPRPSPTLEPRTKGRGRQCSPRTSPPPPPGSGRTTFGVAGPARHPETAPAAVGATRTRTDSRTGTDGGANPNGRCRDGWAAPPAGCPTRRPSTRPSPRAAPRRGGHRQPTRKITIRSAVAHRQ